MALAAEPSRLGRLVAISTAAASALPGHQLLQQKPIIGIRAAAQQLSISPPTIAKSIQHLEELGFVREVTGKQRCRMCVYRD